MPLYGNFGEDVRDEHDRRPLRRDDEPVAERAVPMPTYYRSATERRPPPTDDLATRVAADIFVRSTDGWFDGSSAIDDRSLFRISEDAIRAGRIFAEAVAKEGK